jgi:hypothetical protein
LVALGEIRNQYTGAVVREGQGHWQVQLMGDPSREGFWASPPVMEFEMRRHDEDDRLVDVRFHFLSGEARTLAAHLIRMADKLDFECGLLG